MSIGVLCNCAIALVCKIIEIAEAIKDNKSDSARLATYCSKIKVMLDSLLEQTGPVQPKGLESALGLLIEALQHAEAWMQEIHNMGKITKASPGALPSAATGQEPTGGPVGLAARCR